YSQSAIRPGDAFRAALSVRELAPATRALEDAFVPDRVDGVEILTTGGQRPPFLEGGFLVTLKGSAPADASHGDSRLRGVLGVSRGGTQQFVEVDLALPRAAAGAAVTALDSPWLEPAPAAGDSGDGDVSLGRAFALALLG